MYTRLLSILALAYFTPCASLTPSSEPVRVTIAQTTDVHGWLEGHVTRTEDGKTLRIGGAEVLGGYLHNLRLASDNVPTPRSLISANDRRTDHWSRKTRGIGRC